MERSKQHLNYNKTDSNAPSSKEMHTDRVKELKVNSLNVRSLESNINGSSKERTIRKKKAKASGWQMKL